MLALLGGAPEFFEMPVYEPPRTELEKVSTYHRSDRLCCTRVNDPLMVPLYRGLDILHTEARSPCAGDAGGSTSPSARRGRQTRNKRSDRSSRPANTPPKPSSPKAKAKAPCIRFARTAIAQCIIPKRSSNPMMRPTVPSGKPSRKAAQRASHRQHHRPPGAVGHRFDCAGALTQARPAVHHGTTAVPRGREPHLRHLRGSMASARSETTVE
jgi:hypothetical protein